MYMKVSTLLRVQVEFVPSAVGSFCETFEIAFGDYEVHTFNLTGLHCIFMYMYTVERTCTCI